MFKTVRLQYNPENDLPWRVIVRTCFFWKKERGFSYWGNAYIYAMEEIN